jgi:hypothetical protein
MHKRMLLVTMLVLKRVFYRIIIICGIIGFSSFNVKAQIGWEAGLWVGAAHYFGDLNTNYNLEKPGEAFGLMARYNFNNRVALKFAGNYGVISADDADSKNPFEIDRNLSFRSPVMEVSSQVEFNFLPFTHGSKDEYFSPYFLLGASVFQFNPQTYYNSRWVDLRPLGTEGQFKGKEYYTVSSAFLFGVGLKYDLSERWSMQFELSGRTTFTDYLDDVSSVYPDRRNLFLERGQFGSMAVALSDRSLTSASLPTQDIGKKGFMRGNADNKDAYAFLEVGFLYFFGNLRCPDISRRK